MQLSDVLKLQEKTWTQKGNGVNAVINKCSAAKQDQYAWKQPVNVTDLTGNTMDITFETKYPESLLNQNHIGKRAMWRLKWWTGKRGQGISGYVENQLNDAGQPENWQLPAVLQPPHNQQQAPQQVAEPTNVPQDTPQANKPPDWDAIAEGKVRHGVVCAYISARFKPEIKEVERWVRYIITGIDPNTVPDPDSSIQNVRCEQCGATDVAQCSCKPW